MFPLFFMQHCVPYFSQHCVKYLADLMSDSVAELAVEAALLVLDLARFSRCDMNVSEEDSELPIRRLHISIQ